ncbi:hypothetical protein G9A89_020027 [Geosiphon pyriformis]|nr:hypothetical protein G9A89_020027 [Geosiphon pyriformis]
MSPVFRKNKQDLRNLKLTLNASTILNNLTTPAESTTERSEIETDMELSRKIRPLFFITAWYLIHTSQILSLNARQNLCTKDTMF